MRERRPLPHRAHEHPALPVPSIAIRLVNRPVTLGAMTRPGEGAARLLRALAFVAAALTLTVSAHVLGGGAPSTAGILVTAALVWPAAVLGSASRRRVRHLAPTLVLSQLAGHVALTVFHPASAAGSLTWSCAGHGAHGRNLSAACQASGPVGHVHGGVVEAGLSVPTLPMIALHVGATVLTALVLARGERALWHVVALVRRPLPRIEARRPATRPALLALIGGPASRRLGVTPGRGPPVAPA